MMVDQSEGMPHRGHAAVRLYELAWQPGLGTYRSRGLLDESKKRQHAMRGIPAVMQTSESCGTSFVFHPNGLFFRPIYYVLIFALLAVLPLINSRNSDPGDPGPHSWFVSPPPITRRYIRALQFCREKDVTLSFHFDLG